MDVSKPTSIMLLIVCRNRREMTLTALDRIRRQAANMQVSIAVFDDASSDGTPEAIAAAHPDVHIIHGDGNAFWNGGLYRLWSAMRDALVDAFLWLNDDTWLDDDAFGRLAAAWRQMEERTGSNRFILIGATRGSNAEVTYGGLDVVWSPLAFRIVPALPDQAELRPIDTFNGNLVLVTKEVVEAIGVNEPRYFHNLGDVDYGLRARRAGVPIMLLPGTLGLCEGNAAKRQRGYGSRQLSVFEQWRKVNTHHGLPPRSWLLFTRRHSGGYWPLHFLLPYRHLLKVWRLRSRTIRATNA